MVSVGIRELKAKLSSYIEQIEQGEQVLITDHGREVGIIFPISPERRAIRSLVASGQAHWSGGKPKGLPGMKIRGKPLSDSILEERE